MENHLEVRMSCRWGTLLCSLYTRVGKMHVSKQWLGENFNSKIERYKVKNLKIHNINTEKKNIWRRFDVKLDSLSSQNKIRIDKIRIKIRIR